MGQGFIGVFNGLTGRGRAVAFGGLAAAAMVLLSGPSLAQQEGATAWRLGGCSECHGAAAQGGGFGENPDAPNLHESSLTVEELKETIACGRGEMPFNLRGAYTEISCYGIPVGEVPAGFVRGARLSDEQLDALASFLFENVLGVTRIDRTACSVFFRGDVNAAGCREFPQ